VNKGIVFTYLRILLISLIVAILGLGIQPHAAVDLLAGAYQSIVAGNLLEASQNLARAAEYLPWRFELNLNAGKLAFEAGDPVSAIQYLEHPGTVSHLTVDDMLLLGDAYSQSGDALMAEAIWKRVAQLDDSTQVNERLVNLYLQRKDYASAVEYLKKMLALNPSDNRLYYQVGTLYAATDPLAALPYLVQAGQLDPANASLAKELHDKIRTADLFDQPAYTFIISGRQLANSGQWELAAEAFHRAIALRPEYAEAWAFLGQSLQEMAASELGVDSDAGYAELQHALQLDPRSVLANSLMGLYWERKQAYPQAELYLDQAIAANPNDPYLYSALGNILSKSGDLPAAQSAYESAIQLAPDDPRFYRHLAEFALQNQIQIHEMALPAARRAIALDPGDAASLDVMAQIMLVLQDYRSAERFSLKAIQSDPKFTQAYLHLGTAYIFLGETEPARQWLGIVETIAPDSWQASQARRMLEYYFP
jgi:tetratricopeptide (TPR) repeat protein